MVSIKSMKFPISTHNLLIEASKVLDVPEAFLKTLKVSFKICSVVAKSLVSK